jgi:hypothetical protein
MSTSKGGRPVGDGFSEVYPGADITPAAVEFGAAVERFKREHGRPFPTCSEVLEVVVALGYRKVAEPTPLPGRKAVRS